MWPVEIIPHSDSVYRQIHKCQFQDIGIERFPKESHFCLRDGLSVNWSKYCDAEETFFIIGTTKKQNGCFKDPLQFKVFKFEIESLLRIEGIKSIIHAPSERIPEVWGKPNNRSHSLILYPNDEEIRLELCDYVNNNYDFCICTVYDQNSVIERIAKKNSSMPIDSL